MRGLICFSLIFGLFTSIAMAEETDQTTLYNYSSDRCKNISDPAKLYETAVSLRDSKDPKDQIDAVDCMISSAFRSYSQAEYELARMYSIGFIVMQNQIFAYRWAELAVIDGHPDAKELRDNLENELSIEDVNTAMNQAKKIQSERASNAQNINTSRNRMNNNNRQTNRRTTNTRQNRR